MFINLYCKIHLDLTITKRISVLVLISSNFSLQGLYRGFGSTITREIPFSVIQFPILEYLKSTYRIHFKNNIPLESWEVAVCGSIAGIFF